MIVTKLSPQTDDAKHWCFDAAEWINFIITVIELKVVQWTKGKFS